MRPRPDDPKPGELIDRRQFAEVAALAAYGAGLKAGPTSGIAIVDGPAGPTASLVGPAWMRVKITGGGTGGKYSWKKQVAVPGGTWADDPATITGTTTVDPAYERNGSTTVPANKVVRVEREAGEWRFDYRSCP